MLFSDAVMPVLPADSERASPVALSLITLGWAALQVTRLVISWTLLLVYVPVARSCALWPRTIGAVGAEMDMLANAAFDTLSEAAPLTPDVLAKTNVVPTATELTPPLAFTVATSEFMVCQTAELVTSLVVPLLYVASTLNWAVSPIATDVLSGVTVRNER